MSVNYDIADDNCLVLFAEAMTNYHSDLMESGVTAQILFAIQYDKETGDLVPAVKVHGSNALAKTTVTSLPDRVRGIADAKIIIDFCGWEKLSESRKLALLDHVLEHLTLQYDADGAMKRDDRGRPKLKLRKHDFETTIFKSVLDRHGEASVEASQLRQLQEECGQYLLFPAAGVTTPAKEEEKEHHD